VHTPGCGNGRCEFGEACPGIEQGANCSSGAACPADCPLTAEQRRCASTTQQVASGVWVTRDAMVGFRASIDPARLMWLGPLGTVLCLQPCSGHGRCLGHGVSGYCDCNTGYAGLACSVCSRTFVRVGGTCVLLPGALTSCTDGVRNGNEEGIDCGGAQCAPCTAGTRPPSILTRVWSTGVESGGVMDVPVALLERLCASRCRSACLLGFGLTPPPHLDPYGPNQL
jgi:hypothetical protein